MFSRACELVEAALAADERRRVIQELCARQSPSRALARVAGALRANLRDLDPKYAALDGLVTALDARTRCDGFHVLHDWDGAADRFNQRPSRSTSRRSRSAAAVTARHEIAAASCSTTTISIARAAVAARLGRYDPTRTSTAGRCHGAAPQERPRLASRPATLFDGHGATSRTGRLTRCSTESALIAGIVLPSRSITRSRSCHLRFGRGVVRRDVGVMRRQRRRLPVALRVDHASTMPPATTDRRSVDQRPCPDPSSLLASDDFVERLRPHRDGLRRVRALPAGREGLFAIAFFFNLPQRRQGPGRGRVLRARPWPVSLNDLLTSLPPEGGSYASVASGLSRKDAAGTLMEHARRSPARIRGRLTPAIVYDTATGRHAYGATMRRLRE